MGGMRDKAMWRIVVTGIMVAVIGAGCGRTAEVVEPPGVATLVGATAPVSTSPPSPTAAPATVRVLPPEATEPPVSLDEPTPLPEPTAVPPTPEPATETVAIQPGDTLLGLALARGIELSELQALNPDVRAEALQIGQQIFVPAASSTAPVASGGEDGWSIVAGDPVVVAAGPGLWVLGQVTNEGDVALAPAQLTITLLGEDEAELKSVPVWTAGRRIDAGSTVPYAFYFPDLSDDGLVARVTVVPPGLVGASLWPDLDATDVVVATAGGATEISGRLVNGGDQTVTDLLLTVTFYNAAGAYTGYRQLELPGAMAPGASLPFDMAALPIRSTVDSVTIQIDARPAE